MLYPAYRAVWVMITPHRTRRAVRLIEELCGASSLEEHWLPVPASWHRWGHGDCECGSAPAAIVWRWSGAALCLGCASDPDARGYARRLRRARPGAPKVEFERAILDNTLARYVPTLREADEDMRLGWILCDFGLIHQHATPVERAYLLAEEPEPFDPRRDAFLGAYIEYLCAIDGVETPPWALRPGRYLDEYWYAGHRFAGEDERTRTTTPHEFKAHRIWFPRRELRRG